MAVPRKTQPSDHPPITVNFSDSIRLIHDQVHWTPKGVRLLTKWHFAVGAEVEFAFDHRGERHCCAGIVVGCRPLEDQVGFYETVLFFAEAPCEKAFRAACDCRLAKEQKLADEEAEIGKPRRDGNGFGRRRF